MEGTHVRALELDQGFVDALSDRDPDDFGDLLERLLKKSLLCALRETSDPDALLKEEPGVIEHIGQMPLSSKRVVESD